jgi:hypothetical protein
VGGQLRRYSYYLRRCSVVSVLFSSLVSLRGSADFLASLFVKGPIVSLRST